MNNNYSVKDIRTLEGMEAIRLRPGMYIGSVGPDGVKHIALEIISNSIDEYLNGHCTYCKVQVSNDGTIMIKDNGRGVPFGKAEDGSETLVNVYTKLHTGAKFDSSGKTGYNTSGGMNGVGAKATNALSETFTVISERGGKIAVAKFEKGELKKYEEGVIKGINTPSGTTVTFKPDATIFKEGIMLDYDALYKQLKELAYLSPGMVFELSFAGHDTKTISSQNGIKDYINDLNNKKNTLTSVFYTETMEDRIGVKIAMQYNDSYSDFYKLYTNSIPNTSGTHLTGFRVALTQSINKFARENKLLKEKDNNLIGDELKEGLTLILSLILPDPVFSGQTKEVLSSGEGRTIVQRLVTQELEAWLNANKNDAKAIVEKALLARTAREKAKKAKETVRKQEKTRRTILPGTLADASSTKRSECELFVVEGESAAGSAKEGRNRLTQGVFQLRGKILNTIRADLHKALQNKEINGLIDSIGLEIKNNQIIYEPSKLRYGKIIVASDADVDGRHIQVLFLTFIWKFCPQLIEDGYIYVSMPPLYKVTQGTKYQYLQDDKALEEYRKVAICSFELARHKGLGEMDASELAETVLDPKNRTLKQIQMEDNIKVAQMFNGLMGEGATYRKKFIEENAWKANVDI